MRVTILAMSEKNGVPNITISGENGPRTYYKGFVNVIRRIGDRLHQGDIDTGGEVELRVGQKVAAISRDYCGPILIID